MITIDGDVYPDGVDIDATNPGRLRVAEFRGVEGVWLAAGDDLLGIVKRPEFDFPHVMAACESVDESGRPAAVVPQVVIYHHPDRGLMIQVPDGDGARGIPYDEALRALLAIPK